LTITTSLHFTKQYESLAAGQLWHYCLHGWWPWAFWNLNLLLLGLQS